MGQEEQKEASGIPCASLPSGGKQHPARPTSAASEPETQPFSEGHGLT